MHCDPFDYEDGRNPANVSFEERTFVQESEDKDDIEFSLTVDDESSDDEQEGRVGERDTSSEIDIWKEFREMSVASSQGTLAYDTAAPDNSENSLPGVKGEPECSTVGHPDISFDTPRLDSDNVRTSPRHVQNGVSDYPQDHIKKYTLQNNIVTIPELGMFKRKEPFSGLANIQVIQKMLSQSITPETSELTKAPREPENSDTALRHPLHARETNTTQSYCPELASYDLYKSSQPLYNRPTSIPSTSKSPFEGTEDERRSRLYDSLVRAQRRYAEKLSSPSGHSGHFTKKEWDSLGDTFNVEDWEGGFLNQQNDAYQKKSVNKNVGKKENMGVSSWKGKEKSAVDLGSDGEEAVTLRMRF